MPKRMSLVGIDPPAPALHEKCIVHRNDEFLHINYSGTRFGMPGNSAPSHPEDRQTTPPKLERFLLIVV